MDKRVDAGQRGGGDGASKLDNCSQGHENPLPGDTIGFRISADGIKAIDGGGDGDETKGDTN